MKQIMLLIILLSIGCLSFGQKNQALKNPKLSNEKIDSLIKMGLILDKDFKEKLAKAKSKRDSIKLGKSFIP